MLSSELKEKIIEFIETEITLEQLEEWFVPRLPIFLRSPHTTDADVVSAIELSLAEVQEEIRTETEVRDYLKEVLSEQDTIEVSFPSKPSWKVENSSSNQTIRNPHYPISVAYSVEVFPSR